MVCLIELRTVHRSSSQILDRKIYIHIQKIKSIRVDCDKDVILLNIEQIGHIACHTGRESCFYRQLQGDQWVEVESVIKDPKDIYSK